MVCLEIWKYVALDVCRRVVTLEHGLFGKRQVLLKKATWVLVLLSGGPKCKTSGRSVARNDNCEKAWSTNQHKRNSRTCNHPVCYFPVVHGKAPCG